MKKEEHELLIKNKEKLEKDRESVLKEANDSIHELSKNLIITSSILIGLTSGLLGSGNIINNINNLGKGLFLSSLICFIISIFLGISQFYVDYRFLSSWVDVRSQIIRKISKKEYEKYDDFKKDSIEKQDKLKKQSSMSTTKSQIIFIFLGLILLGFFVYFALFVANTVP